MALVPIPLRHHNQICFLVILKFPHQVALLMLPKLRVVVLERKGLMLVTSVNSSHKVVG